GTVKTDDIAKAVSAAGAGSIDKRNIEIDDHIKSTGNYSATVRLHSDVSAKISLVVVAVKK
ncbi:MAG: 50S ribosomal L9 C-terminal domain-containing protein, partial [Paeniglutamicibacter terrestris]